MTVLERVRRAVAAWFSAEGPALNLAVVRIVVFAILLRHLLSGGLSRYLRLPEELRVLPPGIGAVLRVAPIDEPTVLAVQVGAVFSALLALVGLWTRPAAAMTAVLASYVLGIPYLFGKVDHTLHHLIWFALLLSASPSGDALSLDAWIARRGGAPPPGPARAYALPIRLMWLLIGTAYFFPGLYKLLAGPRWVFGENLKFLLYESWRHHHVVPALRIDLEPALYQGFAAATILFELGFVFLILPRRTRPFAALAGLLFHAGTAYFMRIWFVELMLCYVVFVDWSGLLARRRGLRALPRPAAAPPGWRASAFVGGALIAAQLACGAWKIDSWPFSVYPRFDRVHTQAVTRKLEATLETAAGSRALDLPLRGAMLRRTLAQPAGEARDARLRALASWLARREPALRPGDALHFDAVTYSTLPGRWQDPPLRRERLFDYDAGQHAEPRAEP